MDADAIRFFCLLESFYLILISDMLVFNRRPISRIYCAKSYCQKVLQSRIPPQWYSRMLLLFIWMILVSGAITAQEWQVHTVARGENLTVIARRYSVTVKELKEWNELEDDRLIVGQKLRIPQQDREWYVVSKGDNLSTIAKTFDTTISMLRQLNRLNGSRIYPGQRLRIVPAPVDEAVYIVKRGDTLTEIAQRFDSSIARLKEINGLDNDRIFIGQQLRLREADRTSHIVERGDALWEIARTYSMSLNELKRINDLAGDRIYPGQVLKITVPSDNGSNAASSRVQLADYIVERGDNLHDIARLHQMSLRELQDLNRLSGSLIHPGQKLKVRPLLGSRTGDGGYIGSLDWSKLNVSVPGVRTIQADNGPYFYAKPNEIRQPGKTYIEESKISPNVSYQHARKLFDAFEKQVEEMGRLDDALKDWHFVLDPGHGGIDPGAIIPAKDENEKPYYVVEDEYVYDLALRVYTLLKVHGADVTLTVLASNHLLRSNTPVSSTFVNDRNEVFNDADWNRHNRPSTWPKGGQFYLEKRVEIAKRAVEDTPADHQVFLSFHADNEKSFGNVTTLFYHQNSRQIDRTSRDFALKLLPAMGAGSRTLGRNYGVLRNNPIKYKLLIEARNLAFDEHIWAIRYEKLRQRDAEKIVKALVFALGT
jgi:LysM repeat protein/N-acetylmuramoyl-L-alanine amidase